MGANVSGREAHGDGGRARGEDGLTCVRGDVTSVLDRNVNEWNLKGRRRRESAGEQEREQSHGVLACGMKDGRRSTAGRTWRTWEAFSRGRPGNSCTSGTDQGLGSRLTRFSVTQNVCFPGGFFWLLVRFSLKERRDERTVGKARKKNGGEGPAGWGRPGPRSASASEGGHWLQRETSGGRQGTRLDGRRGGLEEA